MIGAIENLRSRRECKVIEWAQLIGKLVAACPGMDYSFLYTKRLERKKLLAVILNNHDYAGEMVIPKYILSDLDWWRYNFNHTVCKIKSRSFKTVIFRTRLSQAGDQSETIRRPLDFGTKNRPNILH